MTSSAARPARARRPAGSQARPKGSLSRPMPPSASPPRIFDRDLLRRRLDRAAPGYAGADFLKRRAAGDIVMRLEAIMRDFPRAVDLGARNGAFAEALAASDAAPRVGLLVEAELSGAMLAGRADLRARFAPDDPNLPAVLVSEEALAGRFAAPLLGSLSPDLIERVKVLGDLDAIQLYGLSHRAGWSHNQRASVCADLDRPGFGPAFPQLFIAIWNGRPDLQRLFDLARSGDRLRFLRWLIGGGLAEYGLELAALPVVVTRRLTFRLVDLSLKQRSPQPPRRTGPAVPGLVVRESGPAETLTFEASTGRFLQASGLPATSPSQVARVAFETEPGLHPLDAIALMARGVCWTA